MEMGAHRETYRISRPSSRVFPLKGVTQQESLTPLSTHINSSSDLPMSNEKKRRTKICHDMY